MVAGRGDRGRRAEALAGVVMEAGGLFGVGAAGGRADCWMAL